MSDVEYVSHEVAPPAAPAGPPSTSEELSGAAARPRRRFWLRSLTSRLVVGVVSLVMVLVLLVAAATYFALSSFLDNRFDQQLAATTSQNVGFFARCLRTATSDASGSYHCASGPQTQQEWVAAIDRSTGRVFTFQSDYGNDLMRLTLTDDELKALAVPGARLKIRRDGTELRLAAGESDDGLFIVVTGLSTQEISRTLGRLVAVEIVIAAAAAAVALAATSWGVRRSLRNLYRVTGTAREVAAELSPTGAGLERRVPVVEEGTEVGQLAESMNTLLAAVETEFGARLESEQRMRQFLADASHELRTPLTSIRWYAELARMQRAAGDTQQDNLDRIESEGTRMSRLVDDLLLLARGDAADAAAQSARREMVDMVGLLDDAVSGSRAAFPTRPIELETTALPTVLGDRDQLLRVVRNLVTNAAVHTEADRPIRVRGFTGAGGVVVTIADGGPGLPPDQAAHVFERFWRADKARTRARGGSGLGLSIVATIVHAHGGSVRFDSHVETGSTDTVWLPAASQ
jgi:two-component system OmpR family sensor kinase